MTDEEREWLRRRGFEQSPYTKTRWAKQKLHPHEYGDNWATAWLDLTPQGWKLSTWPEGQKAVVHHDTLGLELVPMLAFAAAEGWI